MDDPEFVHSDSCGATCGLKAVVAIGAKVAGAALASDTPNHLPNGVAEDAKGSLVNNVEIPARKDRKEPVMPGCGNHDLGDHRMPWAASMIKVQAQSP